MGGAVIDDFLWQEPTQPPYLVQVHVFFSLHLAKFSLNEQRPNVNKTLVIQGRLSLISYCIGDKTGTE